MRVSCVTCHRFVDLADAGDLSRAIGFVCDDCRSGKPPEATTRPRSDRPPARRIGKGAARKAEPLQVVTVHEVHDTPGPTGAAPASASTPGAATAGAPATAATAATEPRGDASPGPRPADLPPPRRLAPSEPELRAAPARSDPPRAPAMATSVRPSSRPPPAPVVVPEPPPDGKGGRARVVVALLAIVGGVVLLTRVWPSSPAAEPVAAAQRPPHDDTSSAAPVPPPAPTSEAPSANATGSATVARGARPVDTTKPFDPPSGTAPPAPGPAAFDRDAANAAIASASQQVLSCKKPGDPSGVAKLDITFAPSGHVTSSKVGGKPFAGTSTGSCLAQLFRGVSVPPFEGEPVTLAKTVSIP